MLIARGVTETQRSFHGWRARPAGSTVATYGLRPFLHAPVILFMLLGYSSILIPVGLAIFRKRFNQFAGQLLVTPVQ